MRIRLIAVLAASLVAAGCGATSHGRSAAKTTPSAAKATPSGAEATPQSVLIRNYSYHPEKLTVSAGARITFVNRDHTAHTATSTSGAFDTGTLRPGKRATVVLSKPGTYTFYCQFHAFMRGVIVVR